MEKPIILLEFFSKLIQLKRNRLILALMLIFIQIFFSLRASVSLIVKDSIMYNVAVFYSLKLKDQPQGADSLCYITWKENSYMVMCRTKSVTKGEISSSVCCLLTEKEDSYLLQLKKQVTLALFHNSSFSY